MRTMVVRPVLQLRRDRTMATPLELLPRKAPLVDILGDYDSPDDEWKSSNASHGTFYGNICGEFFPTGEKSCAQT